ncbi:MAG: phage shock protein PspA [Bacteriovoracaceae bacterium]|nr:phage shock protein PspA [Bacteriovoracaceae bacterium]
MGIFSRLTDIVNSNIVHMLDKAEHPEKMVRLMIQEMEDTLVEVKSQTAKVIADKKFLERKQSNLKEEEQNWQSKAELAVTKGRDDLAKLALEERASKAELCVGLESELQNIDDVLAKYREDIKQLELKLGEARKKQKNIIMRAQSANSQINVKQKLQRADSNNAILKFEAMERRVDQLEGEVEAFEMGNNLDDEFKRLENENKIADELKALKEKLNK